MQGREAGGPSPRAQSPPPFPLGNQTKGYPDLSIGITAGKGNRTQWMNQPIT